MSSEDPVIEWTGHANELNKKDELREDSCLLPVREEPVGEGEDRDWAVEERVDNLEGPPPPSKHTTAGVLRYNQHLQTTIGNNLTEV